MSFTKNMQEITVEKMVFGGLGLARTSSGVLFVENGLPGEILEVIPESKKHDCSIARIIKIIKESDYRREPSCPYAGICGGCDWLFISYPGQLQFKKEIFLDCLRRIGKLCSIPDIDVYESPEFGYRIRAQIKVDKSLTCGFFRKKSHEVVAIQQCPLLCDKINELLKTINGNPELLIPGDLRVIAGDNGITSDPILHQVTQPTAIIHVGNKIFEVNGGSFFQSNRFLLERLGTWALPFIEGDICVDLYGGTGFFSVMMSQNFHKGLLIESSVEQVEVAGRNYSRNGIEHFLPVHGQVEQIQSLITKKPDVIIIDPPRSGLTKKARDEIVNIGARQILYISCNCSTQARDLGYLVNICGYTIKRMAIFDLYPNTYHLETAVILQKI